MRIAEHIRHFLAKASPLLYQHISSSMADHPPSRNPLRRLRSTLRNLRERHRERHRPTGFGFAFADRVDYLDPARWDALTAHGSLFLRREVLRVIENHGPETIQPRYAMIFRDANPVTALADQVVSVEGASLPCHPPLPPDKPSAHLLRTAIALGWRLIDA